MKVVTLQGKQIRLLVVKDNLLKAVMEMTPKGEILGNLRNRRLKKVNHVKNLKLLKSVETLNKLTQSLNYLQSWNRA